MFGFDEESLQVLLIERDLPPFAGKWALPGGFVHVDETVEAAARRELQEETGLKNIFLEQLYTFGAVDRDPRERVITVAWYALVKPAKYLLAAATDARNAQWFPAANTPSLVFDHPDILAMATERLRNKIRYEPIGFELLPTKFTLRQLQQLYEVVLGRTIDKRNFRKKILSMEILIELNETETNVAHRAARLYRFDKRKYNQLKKRGFHFEV